jgi:hypothetical protein
MRKVSLHTLRVIQCTVANRSVWGTDGQLAAVEFVARTVAILGSFINNLMAIMKDDATHMSGPDQRPGKCSRQTESRRYS